MVLDNATASASDGFGDNDVPTSDQDNFSRSGSMADGVYLEAQSPPNQILIPFDQLPRMSTIMSLSSQQRLREILTEVVSKRCEAAAKTMNRPMRQEEAEAIAIATSTAVRYGLYAGPVGTAIGSFSFYRTMSAGTFPGGWAPGKAENSRFSLDSFGPLKGPVARAFWQTARLGAHLVVWGTAAQLFLASYGLTTSMVRMASDPRLKDYNEILRQKMSRSGQPVRAQDANSTTQQETFEQRRQRRNVQEMAQARRPAQQQLDDASPTGGAFQSDYSSFDIQSELLGDDKSAQQAWPPKTTDRPASTPTAKPQQSRAPQDAHDSMSSTADTAPKESGNAWDRVRQQALDRKPSPGASARNE